MKIQRNTSSYNQRRYGKPWIARVDFSDPKGTFDWGEWVGDHRNGTDGILIVDAKPGDIIATGQKDFRQPRNSAPEWYQVGADGQLIHLKDKARAYVLATSGEMAQVAA